jgi:AraC-like DNA-binding protein
VYWTITNYIVFTAAFIFGVNVSLFAKTDSLKTGQETIRVIENADTGIGKRESLAVELLLKDMDLSVKDDSTDPSADPHEISPVLSKNVLSSASSEKKHPVTALVNRDPISFGKRFYASVPGFTFFKVHALRILAFMAFFLGLFFIIVFVWLRKDNDRFLTADRLSIMDKEVQRACNFIEENYANQSLSIELLCKEMVTGEAFLNALFIGELGITVENFINQVRVNRVKIFLSKDLTIDIGKLVLLSGFGSLQVLQEMFLTITGIEFEVYRNSLAVQVPN